MKKKKTTQKPKPPNFSPLIPITGGGEDPLREAERELRKRCLHLRREAGWILLRSALIGNLSRLPQLPAHLGLINFHNTPAASEKRRGGSRLCPGFGIPAEEQLPLEQEWPGTWFWPRGRGRGGEEGEARPWGGGCKAEISVYAQTHTHTHVQKSKEQVQDRKQSLPFLQPRVPLKANNSKYF